MAPFSNTKSIALFVIFFLAIASSEASRGINPAAAAPAAATVINIDDLFSSVILGQGQHAPLRDYNPYGDPNRTMNITVECLLSIMDFMSCLEYFIDERMSTPPASCCNGFQSLVYSPPCYCQFVNAGWDREYPQYIPHVLDAATKCGIKRATRTTPWLGCDAYMRKTLHKISLDSALPIPSAVFV
jgi:hypothetical protein